MDKPIAFAIITCSDTRSEHEDTAGALLKELVATHASWSVVSYELVKDERTDIAAAIIRAADGAGADIVLTCGGTGLSLRDVTPEATEDACDRDVPGVAEAMRAHSLAITGRAMLSRARCMQRGAHIVINLPGSRKAAQENWECIEDQIDHMVSMMAGEGH